MAETFNLIAFTVGLICLFISIVKTLSQKGQIAYYVYMIFFGIFILPIAIDLYKGVPPTYGMFDNITRAVTDSYVNIIYAMFVIYFSVVFCFLSFRKKEEEGETADTKYGNLMEMVYKKWKVILYLFIFLPLILLIFAPERELFLIYGYSSVRGFSESSSVFVSNIYLLVNVSILAVFAVVLIRNKGFISVLPFLPILLLDIWINGKRNVVVLTLVFLIYILITDKLIKPGVKFLIIICLSGLLSAYFSFYTTIKPDLNKQETSRIEYFRDHTVKFSIYSELYPHKSQILEYKGQSLLLYPVLFVPRSVWEDKPMPYAQYLTTAALNLPPRFMGWGITNSIFDEFISNLGLWIILFFPFGILGIIRFGESAKDKFSAIFTILIISMLFTVEITAYFIVYIIYFSYIRYIRNKVSHSDILYEEMEDEDEAEAVQRRS